MALYHPVHLRLNRYANALTRHHEDAKDLVSETILIAYERFASLKSKDSFVYFLFGIASRVYNQKQRHNKWWGIFNSEEAENSHTSTYRPDEDTDVSLLYDALRKLDFKYSEALVMFEISGLSIKEIAEIKGVTESAVKSWLSRGREKLTNLLGVKKERYFFTRESLIEALN